MRIRKRICLALAGVSGCLAAAGVLAASDPEGALGIPASLPGGGGVRTLAEIKETYRRPAAVPHPKTNPHSAEKADLGRHLFFDPRLSRTGGVSCASCHNPAFDWADGRERGSGVTGATLPRRTPTVLNAAWLSALMWDGRAATLEEQAALPLTAEHEMGLSLDEVAARLRAIPGYAPLFAAAFPGQEIGIPSVLAALATFQRTLLSGIAPFDRWIEGDETAISEEAKRGFAVFNGVARCSKCHSSWRLTDDSFHDIGLPSGDVGRGQFAPPSVVIMQHAFKTPSLRDLRLAGPYMHDGSMTSLDEIVDHYEKGGVARPSLSPEMKPITLSRQERNDLIAYLKTLQGPPLSVQVPRLP